MKYLRRKQSIIRLFLFSNSQNDYSFTYEVCDQMK